MLALCSIAFTSFSNLSHKQRVMKKLFFFLVLASFVYTAKALFGVYDLADKNYFRKGSKIIFIHSGGLQGNRSLKPKAL